MENLIHILQLLVAISVCYVWIFRYHNVIIEFEKFELSDVTRNFVGFSKVILSTLLVTGIWFPSLVLIPSILMVFFMAAAQYYHFKIRDPFIKYVPSLIFLVLSVIIAISSAQ
ncbi:DoxX family protein [Flavobacteriales bacterium]|nr:DoxX family protein [Flavobacteriales bacterium]